MICPKCHNQDTSVVDSRPLDDGTAIRRRRQCAACNFRFSTYEEVEILDLTVIKKDQHREPYRRDKLERGMRRAFEKRTLSPESFKKLITTLERDIQKASKDNTISSEEIGELILEELLKTDKVAYIRFAAVYRKFDDIETFQQALKELKKL